MYYDYVNLVVLVPMKNGIQCMRRISAHALAFLDESHHCLWLVFLVALQFKIMKFLRVCDFRFSSDPFLWRSVLYYFAHLRNDGKSCWCTTNIKMNLVFSTDLNGFISSLFFFCLAGCVLTFGRRRCWFAEWASFLEVCVYVFSY